MQVLNEQSTRHSEAAQEGADKASSGCDHSSGSDSEAGINDLAEDQDGVDDAGDSDVNQLPMTGCATTQFCTVVNRLAPLDGPRLLEHCAKE